MACAKGRASPNEQTRLHLFADSGGYCQNPDCLQGLFRDAGTEKIHIAEMAHIAASSDEGPRPSRALSREERSDFNNLVLLCPTCHTVIDKAPATYTDELVHEWKRTHRARIATAFGAVRYPTREEAREVIGPLLTENRTIFDLYGPSLEYRHNPESEIAHVWRRKMLNQILPNNRRILTILDMNRSLLTEQESTVLEQFRQHVDDLEARHVGNGATQVATRFPDTLASVFS